MKVPGCEQESKSSPDHKPLCLEQQLTRPGRQEREGFFPAGDVGLVVNLYCGDGGLNRARRKVSTERDSAIFLNQRRGDEHFPERGQLRGVDLIARELTIKAQNQRIA